MVHTSYITIFLKDLLLKADDCDLMHSKVNVKNWISCMNRWLLNSPYVASYPTFLEMVHQITRPFTVNSSQIINTFANGIRMKQFCVILNMNETLLNLNGSWEDEVNRNAVINFLIETFEYCTWD